MQKAFVGVSLGLRRYVWRMLIFWRFYTMKFKNPFIGLTKFEWCLWTISVVVVTGSFVLSGSSDILTIIASLIGVTAVA